MNFRLSAHEVGYIVEHSGASVLLVDPELDDALADVTAQHRFVIGDESDAVLYRFGETPQPWDARRGRDRDHQLHERHDRAPEGRAAHAPQPLDQLDHVRLARRRERPRRLPAHVADVPLQRVGHDVRGHRHGRHAHRAAQGRRRRDPAAHRRARRHAHVRRARRCSARCSTPPRRGTARCPGATGAHGRGRRTAADPHHRAHRDRARLGVHPDLRPHRDVAAAHHEPAVGPSTTTSRPTSAPASSAGPARRRSACGCASTTRARCWRAATSCSRATGSSRRRPPTPSSTGGSTPATAASIDDEGYLSISDRKKDVIISGGENVSSIEVEDALASAPRRGRGGGHRRARREVGRDGEGARRAASRGPPRPRPISSSTAAVDSPTSSARPAWSCATSCARTATGKLQKFKLRAPYWEGQTRQVG